VPGARRANQRGAREPPRLRQSFQPIVLSADSLGDGRRALTR
jgi:hypothetical protein